MLGASADPPLHGFRDESVGQPNIGLYDGLHARSGVYELTWNE